MKWRVICKVGGNYRPDFSLHNVKLFRDGGLIYADPPVTSWQEYIQLREIVINDYEKYVENAKGATCSIDDRGRLVRRRK